MARFEGCLQGPCICIVCKFAGLSDLCQSECIENPHELKLLRDVQLKLGLMFQTSDMLQLYFDMISIAHAVIVLLHV